MVTSFAGAIGWDAVDLVALASTPTVSRTGVFSEGALD